MDEKIIRIVASKLRQYEGKPIKQEELQSIRAAVYSATKTNKFASFSNVKKWVKAARSMIKKQQKAQKGAKKEGKSHNKKALAHREPAEKEEGKVIREPAIPSVPKKVEDSVNLIKQEAPLPQLVPAEEVSPPKPQIVFDKVYLQSIKFEIAGIRQTMERVSRQLDKLEKELSSHSQEAEEG
ncbi:MAG: hypothetical protein N3E51_03105 [Candidatus Micrarchaeota archaeon]|nr:hypothetical protein [Candidatus Micrarchaeota archaeon]